MLLRSRPSTRNRVPDFIPAVLGILIMLGGAAAAQPTDGWSHYGGSQHGLQYSPLSQINKTNVGDLEIAWQFRTGETGEDLEEPFAFQTNPLLVDGRLYLTTGAGVVIALDPAEGSEIWRYDPLIDRSRSYSEIANRGVTSWIDPDADQNELCRHRIITGTLDARVFAVDGATGVPCLGFGEAGEIYLNRDARVPVTNWGNYTVTSPPVVVGSVLVVGSAIGDNTRVDEALGIVRGFDIRTGAELWRWDPIPRNAEDPAYAGWSSEEAAKNGAANAWPPLAADVELGLVYVPTGSPSPDFYGGEREGDNRYSTSLVALHAATGELAWYQQLVHHNVWDYDLPAQPTLVELEHDGETIPAVLQATKMGMIFTFNRITGEPIFEIEERPVPQGGVAGEHLSPTQPFPVAPEPYVRHKAITPDDAYGLLLFDEWACEDQIAGLRSEGIYTPPSLEGTLMMPSYGGGSNWGGIAFDPASQTAVVNASDAATWVQLIPREGLEQADLSKRIDEPGISQQYGTPYGMKRDFLISPLGMPCVQPPWGTLTAIDMIEGKINWQVSLGTIEDLAPAIFPNLETGGPTLGGPIVTAGGLIFIGGSPDNYLRAFDLETGDEIWRGRLPANAQATPMTYLLAETGKQYVVIAAGGHSRIGYGSGDYVIAFALPRGF